MFIQTPNETDHVSGGRTQYHPDNENIFEIITWTSYSPDRDQFNGIVTTWQIARYIDPETKSNLLGIFLLEVHVRYKHSDWSMIKREIAPYSVPDQHVRRAGKEGREKLGLQRFDQVHTSFPKEEWEKWLVNPSDQVIGSSHTARLAR